MPPHSRSAVRYADWQDTYPNAVDAVRDEQLAAVRYVGWQGTYPKGANSVAIAHVQLSLAYGSGVLGWSLHPKAHLVLQQWGAILRSGSQLALFHAAIE